MKITSILILILVICTLDAIAQDEKVYKPLGANWTAEMNFSPFSSSPIDINYIRLRKFRDPSTAARLGISLSGKNTSPAEDIALSTFELSFRPGFEKHHKGTGRLSPFIGGEFDIAFKSAKAKDETVGVDTEVKGAWDSAGTERGYLRLGINFITGFDFYVSKNLYIGAEIGYGVELINTTDITFSDDAPGDNTIDGGSFFQFGPNYNSSLRLGFVF